MEKLEWYRHDFSKDTENLIIGFGSVRMFDPKKRGEGFEWDNLLKYKFNYLNFNTMFVGDVRNSWWHTEYSGLDGTGPHALKRFLNEKIKECGAKRTLYLGVSMGGYGALLFGCLTNATQVMSFSPQTLLTTTRRKKSLNNKFSGYDIDESLTDLKEVLLKYDTGLTNYKIWYGSKNTGDTKAAKRLDIFDNVSLHPVNSSCHTIISNLLKNGVFKSEVDRFFEEG